MRNGPEQLWWELIAVSEQKTPNTGKSLEYLVGRARRMALRYAEVGPYRLNPNEDIWEGIVQGIGRQAQTFGWPYCP